MMNNTFYTFLSLIFSLFLTANVQSQCQIFDMVATVSDCNGDNFYVTIDFEYGGVGGEGFKVQGNGTVYGTFEYAALPITIGPLAGNGTTNYEFVAKDILHPDCQDFVVVGPVDCGSTGACDIYDFVAEAGDCNSDGTYQLWLNFQYENAGNDFFDVIYEGTNIGFYALSELPIVIEHFDDNGEPSQVIKVCINDTPDCCAVDEFTAPNCGGGDCNIYDMVVDQGPCEAGMFYVTINFQYENVGNAGFKLQGNGINYGVFSYDDLPVTLGPFAGNGNTFYEFVAKDVSHPDCQDFVDFGVVDCSNTGDCSINDLVADPGSCNSDGTYPVTINFNVNNSITNNFKVFYNGNVVATGNLANLPITIEHFEDNGEISPQLTVCMNDQPNCCAEVEFEAPDCQATDCHIFNLIAEAHPCNNDGFYLLDLAFDYTGVGGDGFKVIANGQAYGPFQYGELFYTIGPLQGGTVYEIVVKDVQMPDCHDFLQFGPVYCNDDCHIFDLHGETSDCDSAGQYYVTLDFEYENVGNDGFKVYGNGNVYGFFGYDDLPVTIGPFPGNNNGELEFGVKDVQNPDCHDFVVLDVPNCNGGNDDCQIADLVADVHSCLGDGTFYVSLEFQHSNTGPAFVVAGNGISYGLFSYDDVPVSIGPLVGNGTTPYEFVVYDLNHPDCHDAVNVGTVECGVSGDCNLSDLVVDPGSCHADGTYNLWLKFDFENVNNNFFDVYYNGDIVGYYPLSSLPIIIPHFEDNGESQQSITVCINDNPNCCVTATYESPLCGDFNVWPGDVNADQLANNFDFLNLGLAYGAEGPVRDILGFEWSPTPSENWPQYFINNTNFKHADCDGNGIVNKQDFQAIVVNYGETHDDPATPVLLGGTVNDPPFFIDLPAALPKGNQFLAPIMLGTIDKPVDNLYGIAFTLNFDPEIVAPSSIDLAYDPSWLGVMDVNLLTFDKTFADAGRIEVALARNDQNDVSGYGQIAGLIGIIDNIAGKESMSISISNVRAIQENEVVLPLNKPVKVSELTTLIGDSYNGTALHIYPNPASDHVYIQAEYGHEIEEIQLLDIAGKLIGTYSFGTKTIELTAMADGLYVLKIKAGGSQYVERFVKK